MNTSVSSLTISIPMNIRMKNISRLASPVMMSAMSIQMDMINTIFSDISIFIVHLFLDEMLLFCRYALCPVS